MVEYMGDEPEFPKVLAISRNLRMLMTKTRENFCGKRNLQFEGLKVAEWSKGPDLRFLVCSRTL